MFRQQVLSAYHVASSFILIAQCYSSERFGLVLSAYGVEALLYCCTVGRGVQGSASSGAVACDSRFAKRTSIHPT